MKRLKKFGICWETKLQGGGKVFKKKRKLDNCLLFYPEILPTMLCFFPLKKECGRYTKIIMLKKGKKVGISLCKYRCETIGRKQCIKEQLVLKEWKQ